MPVSQDVAFPSSLPHVSLDAATIDTIEAEIAAMTDVEVPTAVADLVADARELVAARADAEELARRGYPVSSALFDRAALLTDMIEASAADRSLERAVTTPAQREAMDRTRLRLLQIRAALGQLASAVGLPADLFALGTHRSNRLNVVLMRVNLVVRHARQLLDRLPDRDRAQALIEEAEGLIEAQFARRSEADFARKAQQGATQRHERLERLLLDAVTYLSRQGLTAFADQPERALRYRLDHIYGVRPSRVADPGAGDETGFPDANPDAPDADAEA